MLANLVSLPLLFLAAMPAQDGAASATGGRALPHPARGSIMPGREPDAWAATIAMRLAVAGRARCPVSAPASGLVLQHLSQFRAPDRAGVVAALPLDRGPGVIVVVPGSPAEQAGIQAGDVLLAIDGKALPPETGLTEPFDPARARARADEIDDRLAAGGTAPLALTLQRDGAIRRLVLSPAPACPSRVRVARSGQRNAYADGDHVFLTTGLLARLRSDDELAFVIAHEMAHNIQGHAAVMRGDAVRHGLGRTLGRSGRIVRETERSADRLAGELMLDAGYDPVLGIEMLRRLGGSDLGIALFADHAPTAERIADMRAQAAAHGAGGSRPR